MNVAQNGSVAPALEVSGLTAGYGRTTVVRDVDLLVPRGHVVALLGPNGAGKTTLLSTIAGLIRPTGGTIAINGADCTTAPIHARVRRGLCLVPEGHGIFRRLTTRENLTLQVPPWDRAQDITPALDAFPVLKERLTQTAGTMSGGQQQMLALARAYLANPDVILLDEVSMGLAPRVVDQIFDSLAELQARGAALVLVEQYINRALAMADTVYLLNRGTVTYSGPAAGLDQQSIIDGYLGGQGTATTTYT